MKVTVTLEVTVTFFTISNHYIHMHSTLYAIWVRSAVTKRVVQICPLIRSASGTIVVGEVARSVQQAEPIRRLNVRLLVSKSCWLIEVFTFKQAK